MEQQWADQQQNYHETEKNREIGEEGDREEGDWEGVSVRGEAEVAG